MSIVEQCVTEYSRLKHLKLVAEEVGISWQMVYVHLKKAGVNVIGDKARYGSVSDRLAAYAERLFKEDVPIAIDNNEQKFQATVDFTVGDFKVDVKAAMLIPGGRQGSGKSFSARWSFCISKQKDVSDIFILYAFNGYLDDNPVLSHVFLIPKEVATAKATISIPESLNSKWADYEVERADLLEFFELLLDE